MRRPLAATGALLAAVVVAGCGSGGGSTTIEVGTDPPTTPPISAPAPAPAPTETASPNPGGAEPTTPAAPTPEAPTATGEAAGEEVARTPASFTIGRDGISPATVTVAPFLLVELSVRSGDGRAHAFSVAGTTVRVPAGGRVVRRLAGLKAGRYPISVDGASAPAALIAVDDAGP